MSPIKHCEFIIAFEALLHLVVRHPKLTRRASLDRAGRQGRLVRVDCGRVHRLISPLHILQGIDVLEHIRYVVFVGSGQCILFRCIGRPRLTHAAQAK